MKKFLAGFITGVTIATTVTVYAASVTASQNTYKVTVNGAEANIAGYNIAGSSYFKLRDIADAVGGFDVGFENNTITITKSAQAMQVNQVGERLQGESPSVEDMKTRLAQEVTEGRMTQEQADEMISQMESGQMPGVQRGNPPQGSIPQN